MHNTATEEKKHEMTEFLHINVQFIQYIKDTHFKCSFLT